MSNRRITRLELQLLEKLWTLGPSSVREVRDSLPEERRPAYTTIQTMIYRLEEKGAVRRVKRVGNANIFEAVYTRKAVHRRLISDLLDLNRIQVGRVSPIVERKYGLSGVISGSRRQISHLSNTAAIARGLPSAGSQRHRAPRRRCRCRLPSPR